MYKLLLLMLLLPFAANATGPFGTDVDVTNQQQQLQQQQQQQSVNVGVSAFNKTSALSVSDADSFSKSSAGSSNGNMTINQGSIKYPNQAPAIFTTSAPSFSQRNCTPVGSVNASGPFGGLGVAFPMGGATCDAENIADIIDGWVRDSGDLKLWEVACETLVSANDDLSDAFEKVGYNCHDAYVKRQAKVNSEAKMQVLYKR